MPKVHFLESGVGVAVQAMVGGAKQDKQRFLDGDLEIDEHGIILGIPEGERVRKLYLRTLVPLGSDLVLAQKDRATRQYLNAFLRPTQTEVAGNAYMVYRTMHPILVRKLDNGWLYTAWDDGREYCANKISRWSLGDTGQLTMKEHGIMSPDGSQFMVLDETHWDGQLYMYRSGSVPEIVGKPSEPRFEGFDRMHPICSYGPFQRRLGSSLPSWEGAIGDLDQPALTLPTEPNTAVIKFWHRFMAGGQGPATTADGTEVWVRSTDIIGKPDGLMWDLDWGSRISYTGMEDGGAGGNPLLTGVRVLT